MSEFHWRVLRDPADIESVRAEWLTWQQHPHADLDFVRTLSALRPEVLSPFVIALYRGDRLQSLLVGRLERATVDLTIGYLRLGRVPARTLTFVHGGLLGEQSCEHCSELVRAVNVSLTRERASFASFHYLDASSALYESVLNGSSWIRRDYAEERRPHWRMALPDDAASLYTRLSPKARKNRRNEAARLQKDFGDTLRVECLQSESDVETIMCDAESIAARTYQRGLDVGFAATAEARDRLILEARRGRLRAYILYLRDRPAAFLIGTLSKGVLYDHYTAFDPVYGRYSPGTYLLFHVVDDLVANGVSALDFGFGDAWYKKQLGTTHTQEVNVRVYAASAAGLGLNLLRLPTAFADAWTRALVGRSAWLRAAKRWWRERAQRSTATSAPGGHSLSEGTPR